MVSTALFTSRITVTMDARTLTSVKCQATIGINDQARQTNIQHSMKTLHKHLYKSICLVCNPPAS